MSCLFGNGIFPPGTTLYACVVMSEQLKQMLFALQGTTRSRGVRSCAVQLRLRAGAPIPTTCRHLTVRVREISERFSITPFFSFLPSFLPCLSSLSRSGWGRGFSLRGAARHTAPAQQHRMPLCQAAPAPAPPCSPGFVLPVAAARASHDLEP